MAPDTRSLVLDRYLPYRLSILSNTVSGAIARIYAGRYDLSIPEWRVMAVLGMEQPLTQTQVCERTRMDKVQVSRAVARLKRTGRIARMVDDADRRRARLSLSAAGQAIYDEVAPLTLDWERRLLSKLTETERRALDSLVTMLQAVADEMDAESAEMAREPARRARGGRPDPRPRPPTDPDRS